MAGLRGAGGTVFILLTLAVNIGYQIQPGGQPNPEHKIDGEV